MTETTAPPANRVRAGYPRSLLLGSTFAFAWTPCVGPILGIVLTLAATSGTVYQGALLLLFYSLGLGLWFLGLSALFGWLSPLLRRYQRHAGRIMAVGGLTFIVVGIFMVTGQFTRLNEFFAAYGFVFGSTVSLENSLSSSTNGFFGPAVAFLGGFISFLSPCVLPIAPVCLASLTGEVLTPGVRPRGLMLHATFFVLGFTIVFTVLGSAAGLLSSVLLDNLEWLTRIGGLFVIALGLQMSGLVRLPFLGRTFQWTGS